VQDFYIATEVDVEAGTRYWSAQKGIITDKYLSNFTESEEEAVARPLGVTILAILHIIGGILSLLSAVSTVAMLSGILGYPFYGLFETIFVTITAVSAIVGILGFVIAYGFWNGKGWAWTMGIILAIIGIIFSVIYLPMGIISIIIEAVVIYYLTRPHVKEFFGKGVLVPPPTPLTGPSSDKHPIIRCPNCGHNNRTTFNYCGKCGTPLTEEETKIY